ncbi:hypothetical protein D039_5339A, partial [Vibrio parahaemolyticus EKP-028]
MKSALGECQRYSSVSFFLNFFPKIPN